MHEGEVPVLVSVIIPAYNSARYIAEAIDSVIRQDYSPLEIIVVDDGSSDDTTEVVSGFGDKVQLICQRNQGSAAARNNGIRHARGEYIAFLDADDVWWPHKIRYQMESLAQSGHKMAYSRFIRWNTDTSGNNTPAASEFANLHNPNISSALITTGSVYAELLLDCIVWTSTVIVQKAELEEVGMFDVSLRKGQDYDLWLKLSRRVEMLGLEQATALYRVHPDNITANVKDINYEYLILARAVSRWGITGPDGRSTNAGLLSARLARSSFGHGYAHLKDGNPKVAIESFRESLKHSGFRFKTFILLLAAHIRHFFACWPAAK